MLAAGSGTRMGRPKADLHVNGERLLERAARILTEAGCAPVIAVLRAGAEAPGIRTVVNPDPARGMRSSLQLAVAASDGPETPDALAVLLVDQPGIGVDAVRVTVDAWRPGRIAVATYAGRRAHPIVMSGELWREALRLAEPDEGARQLLRVRPELIDLVPVEGDPTDLDTPDDVQRWTGRT